MKHFSIDKRGRIANVKFDRGSASNALSLELLRELTDSARSFETDAKTSAVVITGREDNFTMGFDLKDPEYDSLRASGLVQQRAGLTFGPRLCRAWEDLPALTISAIEGWCVGGGVALTVSGSMTGA